VKQFAEYFGKSPEAMGAEEVRQFSLSAPRKEAGSWHG
jgi:hypothetical protein